MRKLTLTDEEQEERALPGRAGREQVPSHEPARPPAPLRRSERLRGGGVENAF